MGQFVQTALNFLLPPLCSICKKPVNESQKLCTMCWSGLTFIQNPFCGSCGLPFEFDMGDGELKCSDCLDSAPSYDFMRSVFKYEGIVKKLLLGFKHGDRIDFKPLMASWLTALYQAHPELKADLILPVPIHKRRLFKRRYNQAALLGEGLSQKINVPYNNFLLTRPVKTVPQTGTRQERQRNVQNAFDITPKGLEILQKKTILLIDDVVTTGATIEACAKMLKKAGAGKVNVISLARVVL